MNGALLVNKHGGVSSFGIIELLQRQLMESQQLKRRELPKLGHGGTLDPFATGLLIILVGRAVKLARYFLASIKSYQGVMKFGETSVSGDSTGLISERSEHLPESLEELRALAQQFSQKPYSQIPPMHSAKKVKGRPLYELARAGIEIKREPQICHLYDFQILSYSAAHVAFMLKCSSGTYVRTLTQDFAKQLKTVALLESLHRTDSGNFSIETALTLQEIEDLKLKGITWDQLPCWIPFDQLLADYNRVDATVEERQALFQGKQEVLLNFIKRVRSPLKSALSKEDYFTIYCDKALIGVAKKEQGNWGIERVFT